MYRLVDQMKDVANNSWFIPYDNGPYLYYGGMMQSYSIVMNILLASDMT